MKSLVIIFFLSIAFIAKIRAQESSYAILSISQFGFRLDNARIYFDSTNEAFEFEKYYIENNPKYRELKRSQKKMTIIFEGFKYLEALGYELITGIGYNRGDTINEKEYVFRKVKN